MPDPEPSIALVDPQTKRTFGDVVPTRNQARSKVEEQVRQFLLDAGYRVRGTTVGVLCHHPEPGKNFLTLTPDILFRRARLAVEVDPCGNIRSSRGWTHSGDETKDRLRNALLADVGWTVIRLRLGAAEGNHIGDRDVVVESAAFTKAAQEALQAAIDDFLADRPAVVRFVAKGKSPGPARRRSPVARIGPDRYSDDAYWLSWYPDLESPQKVTLRLTAGGRYLYDYEGLYIDQVDLHEVDQVEWKATLTEYLAGRDPATVTGTTRWPWGDTLLVANPADDVAQQYVAACEHSKRSINIFGFWFTVSGEHVQEWNAESLHREDGTQVVALPQGAIAAGYRITGVEQADGRYGLYQRITISRSPERSESEAAGH